MYRESFDILEGDYRTKAYRIAPDEDVDGPTAVIVGGLHGNETESWLACWAITHWDISDGEIIIVPQAAVPACKEGQRNTPDGNMNRDFPSGTEPTTKPARQLWNWLMDWDPDAAFDIHRSIGLYDGYPDGVDRFDDASQWDDHPNKVGQAIFPTPAARDITDDVLTAADGHLNQDHIPADKRETHRIIPGNTQTGANPLLSHKWGGDTDIPGFLVEMTSYQFSVEQTVELMEHVVETALVHLDHMDPVENYGHDGRPDGPVPIDGDEPAPEPDPGDSPRDVAEVREHVQNAQDELDAAEKLLQGYE